MKKYTFYFIVGSQHLYGEETLKEVNAHAEAMVEGFNSDGAIPCTVKYLPCVTTSKGIEEATLLRLSEVIEEEMPQAKVVTLSGPSHAEEVVKGNPTAVTVASKDHKIRQLVAETFRNEYFRVYPNEDIVGVEIGGALKNIIAVCTGISDGLGLGDNAKAGLITRGLAEITRLAVKMGANEETLFGLAGLGDLVVTCGSKHSRNAYKKPACV